MEEAAAEVQIMGVLEPGALFLDTAATPAAASLSSARLRKHRARLERRVTFEGRRMLAGGVAPPAPSLSMSTFRKKEAHMLNENKVSCRL
jgi:hypothetical protein